MMSKLYKYRDCNINSLKLITEKELWFSHVSDFNDIFEGTAVWHMHGNHDELRNYLKTQNTDDTKIEQILRLFPETNLFDCDSIDYQIKEQVIYSLSETRENILMWSHYADNHRGFCVGFETFIDPKDSSMVPQIKLEELSLDTSKFPFPLAGVTLPVEYNEFMPISNRLKEPNNIKIIKTITTKHPSWSYEKERRIIIPKRNLANGSQAVKFKSHILKEIIFGLKCPPQNRQIIIDLVRQNYPNPQVKFFECTFPDKPSTIADVSSIKYQIKITELPC